MTLAVGDMAPDFTVKTSDGVDLTLSKLRGEKNVVLYFYPGDFTPVCTKETCGFRDMQEDLGNKSTVVFGLSPDSDESHRKFAKAYDVAFSLIADEKREIAAQYQLFDSLGGKLAKFIGRVPRVTFVIDKAGKIAGIFHAEVSASTHLDGVRELVAKLS